MKFVGINIQFPISQDILSGNKSIETRTYPLPLKYRGERLLFIETPGKEGNFKARIVGFITFSGSNEYKSQAAFYKDTSKHLVTTKSPWAWKDKSKHGWVIEKIELFDTKINAPHPRGIIFTKPIQIPLKLLSSVKAISLVQSEG